MLMFKLFLQTWINAIAIAITIAKMAALRYMVIFRCHWYCIRSLQFVKSRSEIWVPIMSWIVHRLRKLICCCIFVSTLESIIVLAVTFAKIPQRVSHRGRHFFGWLCYANQEGETTYSGSTRRNLCGLEWRGDKFLSQHTTYQLIVPSRFSHTIL